METELQRFVGLSSVLRSSVASLKSLVDEVNHQDSLAASVSEAKEEAVISERRYSLNAGFTRFRTSVINNKKVSFDFCGVGPSTCVSLSFHLTTGGPVSCEMKKKPILFKSKNGALAKSALVTSFLAHQVSCLCSRMSGCLLDDSTFIGERLRELEWTLSRLEHTASELLLLERRYSVIWKSSDANASTFLEVELSRSFGVPLLVAKFEFSQAYPFSPINVELDSFDDSLPIEELSKYLVSHAKTGRGFLCRSCDVLTALIK